MYQHALPPGFVLRSKQQKKEERDKENEILMEELIETERAKLGSNLTPVTEESFHRWKTTRLERARQETEQVRATKEAAYRAGKAMHMSGRELFDFDPNLASMDQDAEGEEEVVDMAGFSRRDQTVAEEKAGSQRVTNGGGGDSPDPIVVEAELFAAEDISDIDEDDDEEA